MHSAGRLRIGVMCIRDYMCEKTVILYHVLCCLFNSPSSLGNPKALADGKQ